MTTSDVHAYEFQVAGHLDDHWSAWFENVTIARHDAGLITFPDGRRYAAAVLTGPTTRSTTN
jgi:hypothetical protein